MAVRPRRIKKSGQYRSRYEQRIADWLTAYKIPFEYETQKFVYYRPHTGLAIIDPSALFAISGAHLEPLDGDVTCYGTVYVKHIYTTDFWLPEQGINLEAKGRFTSADRSKILKVLENNPDDIDLRLVLMRNQRLNKRSNTMYSDWCEKHGIKYVVSVDGEIPLEWLKDG